MLNSYLFVKTDNGTMSVHCDELVGIVAYGRICYFILTLQGNPKEHRIVYASHHLGYYVKQIEHTPLAQCHRSYVVNIDFVDFIRRDKTLALRVQVKDLFVVSRRYHKKFIEKFKKMRLPVEI